MRRASFPRWFLWTLVAALAPVWAAPTAAADKAASGGALDTAAAHRMYVEGDFAPAIAILEKALRENRLPTHEDSVFVFKHLGVMHAAIYNTRETGKQYMYQLLYIEPTAKIMDMYASDMIYMIFKNVQEEVEINRVKLGKGRMDKEAERPGKGKGAKKSTWPYWTAGAIGVVGLGVGTYFLFTEEIVPGKDYGVN